MTTNEHSAVLALHIGDTNIAGGVVAADGRITSLRDLSTMAQQGGEAVMTRVTTLARELYQENPGLAPQAVGVGSVGLIDPWTGQVTQANAALPGWQDMPIRDKIQRSLQLPTFVINDGQAMTLGEAIAGVGQGYYCVIGLTVDSTISGGMVIKGRPYYGAGGSAGAAGHIIIDYQSRRRCSCGRSGCLEAYASAPTIIGHFLRSMGRNRIREELQLKSRQVGIKEIADLVRAGHSEAMAAIERGAHFLGIGLASVLNLLNPDVIVIGGSVAQIGEIYFSLLRQVVQEQALPNVAETPIVPASLGLEAHLIGAAHLAWQRLAESIEIESIGNGRTQP